MLSNYRRPVVIFVHEILYVTRVVGRFYRNRAHQSSL
jgi:hypothetical protein